MKSSGKLRVDLSFKKYIETHAHFFRLVKADFELQRKNAYEFCAQHTKTTCTGENDRGTESKKKKLYIADAHTATIWIWWW